MGRYSRRLRFERELEALRKELAESAARSGHSSPVSTPGLSRGPSDDGTSSVENSPPLMNSKFLPEDPPDFNLQPPHAKAD